MTLIALHRTTTLGNHGNKTACALAQLLDLHEFIIQTRSSACRKFFLGRTNINFKCGHQFAKFALCCVASSLLRFQLSKLLAQAGHFTAGEIQAQSTQFANNFFVTTCSFCLALQRAQLATHFANEVLHAKQVGFSGFKATLGFFLALAVLKNSCSFFDDGATVFCTRSKNCINLALADDDVLLTTNTGIGQEFLNIEQTTLNTIDGVLGVTVTEECARHRDLGEVKRQQTCRVVESQHDFCAAKR